LGLKFAQLMAIGVEVAIAVDSGNSRDGNAATNIMT
jgi:hypothetical protein